MVRCGFGVGVVVRGSKEHLPRCLHLLEVATRTHIRRTFSSTVSSGWILGEVARKAPSLDQHSPAYLALRVPVRLFQEAEVSFIVELAPRFFFGLPPRGPRPISFGTGSGGLMRLASNSFWIPCTYWKSDSLRVIARMAMFSSSSSFKDSRWSLYAANSSVTCGTGLKRPARTCFRGTGAGWWMKDVS